MQGNKIQTLIDRKMGKGYYTKTWNIEDQASGIYHYRFRADKFIENRQLIIDQR